MNFCFEFFFFFMYCSESPSVYSDLWNNQKRREENGGTLQTHSIHQSAFNLGLPFLVSSEFHSERHLPCVCSFSFFFAQQHLTISWSWHRLQCYRDFVVPNVQKMQMSNTYGTKWTEGTSASSLFPLLMSILESLGFLTELTPESLAPLPLLISLLVQHKALYSCVQMILSCFSVIWLIKVIQTTVILIYGEPVIWLVAERCEHKSEFSA